MEFVLERVLHGCCIYSIVNSYDGVAEMMTFEFTGKSLFKHHQLINTVPEFDRTPTR